MDGARNRVALCYTPCRKPIGILNVDDESFNSDLVDWGFSEPNAYYSNVNGGTGIVGAVQCSVYTVDLESVMPAD